MLFKCEICQWIYDENVEGTPFSELPEDYTCPMCGVDKSNFVEVDD